MDYEEEFVKKFKAISHGQNSYEMWDAFVSSFAAMIAVASMNKCDWLVKRADASMRNTPATPDQVAELWIIVTDAFEESPNRDLLGSLYMKLGLGSKETGQFFTPYHISKMTADIAIQDAARIRDAIKERGYATVNDPAAGGGANLIAFANACREMGINYQQQVLFIAQELSELTALTCYVQLSLLGCAGAVYIGDSLKGSFRTMLTTPAFTLGPAWHSRLMSLGESA